jgi:hypothetical protein
MGQRRSPARGAQARRQIALHIRCPALRQSRADHLEGAGHPGQKVVEIVRQAAGELAHRLHLLRLAQRLFRFLQPCLFRQSRGHVVDELIGPDLLPALVAQDAEAHFIIAAVGLARAEPGDLGELFPRHGAGPQGAHGGKVFGLVRQRLKHVRAHHGLDAKDAFELRGGGSVDGDPAIVHVGDLNEGAGPIDDISQQLALRQGLAHPTLKGLVKRLQRHFGPATRRDVVEQHRHLLPFRWLYPE